LGPSQNQQVLYEDYESVITPQTIHYILLDL